MRFLRYLALAGALMAGAISYANASDVGPIESTSKGHGGIPAIDAAVAFVNGAYNVIATATFGKIDPQMYDHILRPMHEKICDAYTWRFAQHAFDPNFDVKTLPAKPDCTAAAGKVQ